ncbi:hypothetical protein [Okeania sp. KiyG1]|uniref:hypothetical protein n=1 Tax=Okeania sp. KiyG1 TaxID=2720165 RepID=UPI001921994B|nr:hypothetical protein [Okeania sp. KiyG1]
MTQRKIFSCFSFKGEAFNLNYSVTGFTKLIPGLKPPDLEIAWNKHKASGKNCTDYLEEYIFKRLLKYQNLRQQEKLY